MLFVVGTRSYDLEHGRIENFCCPKCSRQTALNYSVYKRYTHLTLIPIFPVGNEVYTACSSCSEPIETNELSEELKLATENLKKGSRAKTPFWMFSGTVILIGFAIFGTYSFLKTDSYSELYLKNPKHGDVVNFKLPSGYYTTVRIDKVTKDSVHGILNDYEVYLPYEAGDMIKLKITPKPKSAIQKKNCGSFMKKEPYNR